MSYFFAASLRCQASGQFAVPGQQRRGRHGKDAGPATAGQEPRQRGEPHPVGRLVPHPAGVPAQHRVLVPEHKQLSILRPVATEHQDSHAEYPAHQQVDDLQQHPVSQPSLRSIKVPTASVISHLSIRAAHPERFVRKPPAPPAIPDGSWINPPEQKEAATQ